jgi:hypothetical protein
VRASARFDISRREARVLDVTLAERLGFDRPRDIRQLIERNLEDLSRGPRRLSLIGILRTILALARIRCGEPENQLAQMRQFSVLISNKKQGHSPV